MSGPTSSGASGNRTRKEFHHHAIEKSYHGGQDYLAGLNHPELPLEEADIAVFGIPYDGGVSFRSGTCEAPQELRKITHTISPTTEDFRDISPVKVKDLGDCVGKDRDEMFAEAEELAYQP